MCTRSRGVAGLAQDIRQVDMTHRIVRMLRRGPRIGGTGGAPVSLGIEERSQIVECAGMAGIARQQFKISVPRRVAPTQLRQQTGPLEPPIDRFRRARQTRIDIVERGLAQRPWDQSSHVTRHDASRRAARRARATADASLVMVGRLASNPVHGSG
jgi:hypothetical protein